MNFHDNINMTLIFHTWFSIAILMLCRSTCADESLFAILPDHHTPFYKSQIQKERNQNVDHACWGHEPDCKVENSFSANFTKCQKESERAKDAFFNEADFGYIKQRRENLLNICTPKSEDQTQSSLICSNQLQFCSGKNIRFDFRGIANSRGDGSLRYNMDVLRPGEVTARCRINKVRKINKYHVHTILFQAFYKFYCMSLISIFYIRRTYSAEI